jgi:hypothetical protein
VIRKKECLIASRHTHQGCRHGLHPPMKGRRDERARRCRGNGGRAGEFTSQSPRGLELSGRGSVYECGRNTLMVSRGVSKRRPGDAIFARRWSGLVCASCARIARNCLLVWGEEWAVAGSKYAQLTGNRRGWVEILDVEEAPGVLRHPNAAARFLRGGLLPSCMHARRKKRDAQEARDEESYTGDSERIYKYVIFSHRNL